jgi:hypothetical protein
MGKNEALSLGDAPQHSLGILAKLQHGHRLHQVMFKLKLKSRQRELQVRDESGPGGR